VGGGVILHWTGTAWQVQKSPSRGIEPGLSSVAATSATNAWAVGSRGYRTLIEHWNGTAWQVQKSPNPGIEPGLSSVAATSAKNAWAVGGITDESGRPIRALIEHWNGTAWKVQPSPRLAGDQLYGVAATSAKNAWAVGSNQFTNHALIEHWNGMAWNVQPTPGKPPSLSDVAATSAKNAWAVGYYSGKQRYLRTLALHWNGTAWSPAGGRAGQAAVAMHRG
jgi:hypothetical protein